MSAPVSLRVHAAEASRVFEWAIEDDDDVHLVDVVERAPWALLQAAETERRFFADARSGHPRG